MPVHPPTRLLAAIAALLVSGLMPASSFATSFQQTNLVSDVPGLAISTDPNLVNPWGVAFSATSPFWIADQGSSSAAVMDGAGNVSSLLVNIPTTAAGPQGPTGEVAAPSGSGFNAGSVPAHFIFDGLNGTISAWASGTSAVSEVTTPGAVYTGLALAAFNGSNYLYAADAATGTVRVFNTSYNQVSLGGTAFVDPNLPAGYVPFNIQLIGSTLYVTYAELGPGGVAVPGSGGFVDEFSTGGNFLARLTTNGQLNAPWGITLAPSTFGSFGGDLLIGNFGNGEINAYSSNGTFEGTLDGPNGMPLVNDFLWSLDFDAGGPNDNPNALYFTAGIDNQTEGLFGEIAPTPEPSTFILAGIGLVTIAFARLRHLGLRMSKCVPRST